MYLPSLEKRTSEIDEIISEKNDREEGSSSCSNSDNVSEEIANSSIDAYVLHASRKEHSHAYQPA